ncbi:MAG: ComEC/Rec2 family competence protein [Pirellulales bacterium]|nr:ComEC/Rec2 family competence protein [Pirellulales bacterium]
MPDHAAIAVATDSRAPRYQPLVLVLGSVCVGILTDRYARGWFVAWWLVAAAGLVLWLVAWRRGCFRAAAWILLPAVAAGAAAWHHGCWSLYADDDVGRFVTASAQPVCADVVAVQGPVRLPAPDFDPMRIIPAGDRTRLEVEVAGLRDGSRRRPASGRATLVVDGHLPGVHAGDRLRVFAQLSAPRSPANPGEADRAAYARRSRVRAILRSEYPDCVTVLARPAVGGPGRWVEALRRSGDRLMWQYIHPRRAALASALLLGIREELGDDRNDAFLETGTVHLLSISGLHVGIVAGALLALFRLTPVPRRAIAAIVSGATVAYTLVTGAEPPAVRAAVLVVVMCAGYAAGKRGLPFNSLAAAALVVLAINPAELFSVGAQLSFLSVAGMMWFAPHWMESRREADPLDRLIEQSRSWPVRIARRLVRMSGELVLVSAAIWLLTLPLVAARFHLVSPVALLLNVVIWLPVSIGVVSGFLVLTFGWLLPPLGALSGWLCDVGLWLTEAPVDLAQSAPLSHFWVAGPAEWWLAGFYGILATMAAVPQARPSRRCFLAVMAGWSLIGLSCSLAGRSPRCLECTFLSVGHGCAALIRLPSGEAILYDAGQLASPELCARTVAGALWSRGIVHVDAMVLSHDDADHYNAVPELLRMFRVGSVYVPPLMFDKIEDSPATASLQRALLDASVPIHEISAGARLHAGEDGRIEVIHPERPGVSRSDNANSLVLAIEHREWRILLPGDLEPPGLDQITARPPWDCDVLLVPHHGSRRSDPPGLAAWCTPEWVVISGSRSRDWDAAATAYQAGGAQIFHTAYCGAVCVRVSSDRLDVVPFHPPR